MCQKEQLKEAAKKVIFFSGQFTKRGDKGLSTMEKKNVFFIFYF